MSLVSHSSLRQCSAYVETRFVCSSKSVIKISVIKIKISVIKINLDRKNLIG